MVDEFLWGLEISEDEGPDWREMGFEDVERISVRDEDDELIGRIPTPKKPGTSPVPEFRSREIDDESESYVVWKDPETEIVTGEIQVTPYDGGRIRTDVRRRNLKTGQFEALNELHNHPESIMTSGAAALVRSGKKKAKSELICSRCGFRNHRIGHIDVMATTCDGCGKSLY